MARLSARRLGAGSGALFDVREVSDLAGYDPASAVPPTAWPDFSAGIEVECACPKCGYGWVGSAKPAADELEVAE